MGKMIGMANKYFRLVNCIISIPVNKVENITMVLRRRRIPIEISMCAIGLYILHRSIQSIYAAQRIMLIMKDINIFIRFLLFPITSSSISPSNWESLCSMPAKGYIRRDGECLSFKTDCYCLDGIIPAPNICHPH